MGKILTLFGKVAA